MELYKIGPHRRSNALLYAYVEVTFTISSNTHNLIKAHDFEFDSFQRAHTSDSKFFAIGNNIHIKVNKSIGSWVKILKKILLKAHF